MNELQQGEISRAQWESRYAARVRQQTGMDETEAAEIAKVGAQTYEEQERGCNQAVTWWGGPSGCNNTPEDEADEELSYWTNDEPA